MQVLPGVYQVNGSPYGRHQNAYVVHRNGATLLIDSGDLEDAETLPEVERNAARWGLRLEDCSHLLVTHEHIDHGSHAAELQRRGLAIVCSLEAADAMATGDKRCAGWAVGRTFEPVRADILLRDGEELAVGDLRVCALAAPGHCAGLLVYEMVLDGERVWFASDLFEAGHAHRTVLPPWTGGPDWDRDQYVTSLERLLGMPPCDHLLPGHGPAALGNGRRVLEMAYEAAVSCWWR